VQWTRALFVMAVAVYSATTPAVAHHAFSSEFDEKKPVKLEGRLTRMEWVNPHCWIHVAVKQPNGKEQAWMIEAGTPNVLLRRGFTRKSLTVGTQIIVDGYRAKDGSFKANGRDVTFPDGRKLFLGSSGTGAPSDGRDPNERKR
jgi:hypothetical protein